MEHAIKPLNGIRVLDLSNVIFGPYASQILADYGADVIKVEPPEGDSTRRTGPAKEENMAASFIGSNRSKRSIVLDLKNPAAQEALLALVDGTDIFMHNIRPQKLTRIGIEPEAILKRNPRIIYAALTGFMEGGPYSGMPAYDDIIQGMSGLADLVERYSGEMRYTPSATADKTCGMTVAHAILAALFARERSGKGSYIEIPMFESMVAFNLVEHFQGLHFEPAISGPGYVRVLDRSRKPYRTTDGFICMMPYTDEHWRQFFGVVGAPELASDPRFVGIANRTRNICELLATAADFIAKDDTRYWMNACKRLQIPAAPVTRLQDLTADEHLVATNYFEAVEDEAMGTVHYPGVPVKFNGQRPSITMAPRLGEHTRAVLAEAGMSKMAINELVDSGAARQHVTAKPKAASNFMEGA
jgi:crotonobetainyl-CoA:carnitine CoA-transferase CaiB-like acyl-CoA transferase